MSTYKIKSQRGFTIVELMIALSVLSVILVIGTTVLIQIGNIYAKGVNAANLQNATRNVVGDLTSTLQFSGNLPAACTSPTAITCPADPASATSPPNPDNFGGNHPVYAYCINTTRYSYIMNRKLGTDSMDPDNPTHHVLWRDKMNSASECAPLDITKPTVKSDGLAEGSSNNSSGYEMMPDHVRLTRFMVRPNADGYKIEVWTAFGDSDLVNTNPANGSSNCHGGKGTQFCAISKISTSVTRRLGN